MLRVENVSKRFKKKGFWAKGFLAVDSVSFEIKKGETLALVGESGCGKSTLARLILNLIPKDRGKISYQGRDLDGLDHDEVRMLRKKMQIVFQHPDTSLNPMLKIIESMKEPFHLHSLAKGEDMLDKIKSNLAMVGLSEDILERYPHQVSGGQIQRVVLARVLLMKPDFIVLDEPTSMLDVSVQAQIMDLLKKIQSEVGVGYLLISHDLDLVSAFADRIAIMEKGRIIEIGDSKKIRNEPECEYTRKLLQAFSDFHWESD